MQYFEILLRLWVHEERYGALKLIENRLEVRVLFNDPNEASVLIEVEVRTGVLWVFGLSQLVQS